MTEQPDPEQPPAAGSRPERVVKNVGTALGCLVVLVLIPIVGLAMLAIVLDEPAFWMAFVALCVAVAAYKASRRRR